MANFLSGCACRGIKPKNINLKDMHVRDHLISILMEQRSVLRMICAPNGFGKSVLAAQYADLVFSFKNVFIIDCQSPCFIRDLDSKALVTDIIQICESPNLVIFDDISLSDEFRNEMFSKVIDELLEYNCEVICTARPFNDAFLQYQPDAHCLNTQDLIANQDELNFDQGSIINRIPIVAWESKNSVLSLIKRALSEDFTNAIMFALFYIYLFGEGKLADLEKFLSKSDIKLLLEINKSYLYFGIDENNSSFSVPSINTSKFVSMFSSKIQTLINVMSCTDRSDLAEKLCSLLVKKNKNNIAVDVSCALGDKELRINILEKFNEDSIKNLYLISASKLYNKINFKIKGNGLFTAFQAIRLAILNKNEEAVRFAYSVLDDQSNSLDNKLLACLVFMRFGHDNEKNQALKIIRHICNDFKIDTFLNSSKLSKREKHKCELINKLVTTYFAIYSESKNPFEVWLSELGDELCDKDIIAASCLFDSYLVIDREHFRSEAYNKFIRKLSGFFRVDSKIDFTLYVYALLESYYKSFDFIATITSSPVWNINDKLFREYDSFKASLKNEILKSGFLNSNISSQKNFSLSSINLDSHQKYHVNEKGENIPKLRINVLGGLSAFIGNNEIIDGRFGRQNIKLICCILALEKGNEVSKDKISGIIWPDSSEDRRRINMNSHWSVLKSLFSLPNGDCPYLIRNQRSYKLAPTYLESDIFDFDHICAELTLGTLDSQAWWDILEKNENLVSGILLPSETQNSYIRQKRTEYKNKIVDALVAASERLVEAGEVQQALWFAHKALSQDSSREDVYVVLMKAQIKAGQRTPAIETYFACKKFLDEEMGIEPSKAMFNLYSGVITETPV